MKKFNLKKEVQEPTGDLLLSIIDLVQNSNNDTSLVHLFHRIRQVEDATKQRYYQLTGKVMIDLKIFAKKKKSLEK